MLRSFQLERQFESVDLSQLTENAEVWITTHVDHGHIIGPCQYLKGSKAIKSASGMVTSLERFPQGTTFWRPSFAFHSQ